MRFLNIHETGGEGCSETTLAVSIYTWFEQLYNERQMYGYTLDGDG
jgi:hypothetical protein